MAYFQIDSHATQWRPRVLVRKPLVIVPNLQNSESVMIYLIAIFTPPLYFIIKKKWLAAAVTTALFILSVCLFIAIPILWPICAISAVWDVRKSLMREHAKMIAQEVGKAMRQ